MRSRSLTALGAAVFVAFFLSSPAVGCNRLVKGTTTAPTTGSHTPAPPNAAVPTSTTLKPLRGNPRAGGSEEETAPAPSKPKVLIEGTVGKPVKIGSVRWHLKRVWKAPTVGEGDRIERAAGVFVVARIKATMRGQKLANLDEGQIKVVDDLNRQFYPSRKSYVYGNASLYRVPDPNEPVSIYDTLVVPLKKRQSATGFVCFDVPKDAVALKLHISDIRDFSKTRIERYSGEVGVFDLDLD